jgi:thiosulfate reductase cytochrome b subunit
MNNDTVSTSSSAGAVAMFLVFAVLYLLPSLVAAMRGVRRAAGLSILNLLLGWTVLGWIGALIWAVQAETNADVSKQARPYLEAEARLRQRHPELLTPAASSETYDAMHRLGRWLGLHRKDRE